MRQFFVLYIASLITLFSCKQPNDFQGCSIYKTGSFIYKIRDVRNPSFIKITRNDSTQTEIISHTGDKGILSVNWIDSCTYLMNFKEIISTEPDSLTLFKKSMTIKTKITGGTQDYYLFESSNDKNDFILRDTIWFAK